MKWVLIICLFMAVTLRAQGIFENNFKMPLKEVFDSIESIYNVKLTYSDNMVKGRVVEYALYRFEPNFITTLNNITANQNLVYLKNDDGSYLVRPFDHYRTSPETGVLRLKALEQLYSDSISWERRKAQLKLSLGEILGIASFRDRLQLNMMRTPKRKMQGYSIENYALETLTGLYVCGSIYRPRKINGKAPLVIVTHGHSPIGRYDKSTQSLCASFARMGAIAVSCDMFGYGESQLCFDAKEHQNSIAMRVQLMNQMALLDYFSKQNDVDISNIAVTGASGGASQAIFITALDDRITVSAPVVMVSSYFNGGCACESGMPIHTVCGGTSNVEIATMAAPRPMLIVSDGKDWTDHVPEYEYPFIQRTYGFYGKQDVVTNVHLPLEGHDYGISKREAVYEFMAKQLNLNLSAIKTNGEIDESSVTIENVDALKVFGVSGEHLPSNAIKGLKNLCNAF